MTSTTTSAPAHTHIGRSDVGVVCGAMVTLLSDNGSVCKYARVFTPDSVQTAPSFIFHDLYKPA
jgi:hypothetical protein